MNPMNTAKKAALLLVATGAVVGTAGTATAHGSGAGAGAVAATSPGVISGNVVQAPIGVPINLTGNTVNVAGLLNPAFGNYSVNG